MRIAWLQNQMNELLIKNEVNKRRFLPRNSLFYSFLAIYQSTCQVLISLISGLFYWGDKIHELIIVKLGKIRKQMQNNHIFMIIYVKNVIKCY